MRNKRRNTYVVNHPLNIDLSSKESFSNSIAQSNTTNYDLSSSAPESSSIQPAHGSMKSIQSLDDTMPHQIKRSQYSIDQPSTTESSTTDLVTST